MEARRLGTDGPADSRQQLALWVPPEEESLAEPVGHGRSQQEEGGDGWIPPDGHGGPFAHRILDPVRSPDGEKKQAAEVGQKPLNHRVEPGGERYDWAAAVAGEAEAVEIPEGERVWFSERYTLRGLYEHPVYGLAAVRASRVADATLAAASAAKDRQALNRWERYSPRPGDWPAGEPWRGRPLAWISDKHVAATVGAMRKELALSTCRSTWNHLRTIFRRAWDVKAIERVPEVTWGRSDGTERAARAHYTDRQLVQIWTALAGQLDLQVAFVVSVNVGLRTVDLFCLRWDCLQLTAERPVVEFTARKTGKRQTVPLGPATVRQLDRWRRAQGLLFPECAGLVWPELTDATAADPERSRAARCRNARFKRVLAGLDPPIRHAKPWQVGRLTCNERLERHRPGSGQFVLGHSETLNSTSYREPSGLIYEAVVTLPQPAEW